MKKSLLVVATIFISACSDESKFESACAAIARDASVDPSALVINKTVHGKSEIKLSEVYSLISEKYGRNTPKWVTDHTDELINRSDLPVAHTVAIDWTGSAASGRVRSFTSCTFISGALPQAFLSQVEIGNETFEASKLNNLFNKISIPAQLDSSLFVK